MILANRLLFNCSFGNIWAATFSSLTPVALRLGLWGVLLLVFGFESGGDSGGKSIILAVSGILLLVVGFAMSFFVFFLKITGG